MVYADIHVCAHTEATGECGHLSLLEVLELQVCVTMLSYVLFMRWLLGHFNSPPASTMCFRASVAWIFMGGMDMAYSSTFPQLQSVSVYQIP